MKFYLITFLLILINQLIFAQNLLLVNNPENYIGKLDSNDSLFIFSILDTCLHEKVEFRNAKTDSTSEGLIRTYRNTDKGWKLIHTEYWANDKFVWAQEIAYNDYMFPHIDNSIYRKSKNCDSIIIPFENGKVLHKRFYKNSFHINEFITNYPDGNVFEIIDRNKDLYKEYYPNGQLKINIKADIIISRISFKSVQMEIYSSKGVQLYNLTAHTLILGPNRDDVLIREGILKNLITGEVFEVKKGYKKIPIKGIKKYQIQK